MMGWLSPRVRSGAAMLVEVGDDLLTLLLREVSHLSTLSHFSVLFCLRALSHLGALSHSRVVVSANEKARFLICVEVNCPILASRCPISASRCPNLVLSRWSQLASLLRAAHPYLGRGLLNFPAPPGDRVGGRSSVVIRGKLGPFRASARVVLPQEFREAGKRVR